LDDIHCGSLHVFIIVSFPDATGKSASSLRER